jgi:Protein of unknown function (DUF1153)
MERDDDATSKLEVPFFHGPEGRRITLAQLPRPGLKRWLPRHKALVVAAVRHGLLTFDEACKRYPAYAKEFLCWHSDYRRRPTLQRTQKTSYR